MDPSVTLPSEFYTDAGAIFIGFAVACMCVATPYLCLEPLIMRRVVGSTGARPFKPSSTTVSARETRSGLKLRYIRSLSVFSYAISDM
jgi:hypothetical protein